MPSGPISFSDTRKNLNFTAEPNPSYKKDRSFSDLALSWFGESQAALFRASRALHLNARLLNETLVQFGKVPSESLKGIADASGMVSRATGPFRLYSLFKDVRKAFSEWNSEVTVKVAGLAERRFNKLVHSVSEATSMTMNSLSMVFSSFPKTASFCNPIRKVADVTSWTADISSAVMSVEDFNKSRELVEDAKKLDSPVEVQVALEETKKRRLLAVVKDVCGAASAVLGVVTLASGFALAPAALLTISLVGNYFAIWGALKEESMEYKPFNYFKAEHINAPVVA